MVKACTAVENGAASFGLCIDKYPYALHFVQINVQKIPI